MMGLQVFHRLLEVLRPKGGPIVVLEGYFDESGDLNRPPGVFCVSGYLIDSEAAKEMDRLWRAVLAEHRIDYFHMVDCAHEPPRGPFAGMGKDERSLIARKLIDLIKAHTLRGLSVVARASTYQGPRRGEADVYTQMAAACAFSLQVENALRGREEGLAYFFEKGHSAKSNAYRHIASKVARDEDSLTFAGKTEVPLLQAADILAWQTAKYAKDYFYPFKRDGAAKPIRWPRRDFQSLMEHLHEFLHLDTETDVAGVEIWPMELRGDGTVRVRIWDGGDPESQP